LLGVRALQGSARDIDGSLLNFGECRGRANLRFCSDENESCLYPPNAHSKLQKPPHAPAPGAARRLPRPTRSGRSELQLTCRVRAVRAAQGGSAAGPADRRLLSACEGSWAALTVNSEPVLNQQLKTRNFIVVQFGTVRDYISELIKLTENLLHGLLTAKSV
jgi:hypothetical protein